VFSPADREASLGDEALLAGVRSGGKSHFNALYARYFGRIHAFVSTRASNHAGAEEHTQEVFAAVFRSAGGFGERATPLSRIYGSARNTLLNSVPRERAREARLASRASVPPAPEWSFTLEDQYRQNRIGEEVERRLATLASWQLDVFRLRHVEDLPIDEIAQRITRSEDAVRSGLYRAKRLMFEAAGLGGSKQ
jgi:RNA polymerase sigma-70 factor (ECF subfamily)